MKLVGRLGAALVGIFTVVGLVFGLLNDGTDLVSKWGANSTKEAPAEKEAFLKPDDNTAGENQKNSNVEHAPALDGKHLQTQITTVTPTPIPKVTLTPLHGATLVPLYSVTIKTIPPHAKIRILNIKPRYTVGMKLAPGNYHVEATAEGYKKSTKWIKLNSNEEFVLKLEQQKQIVEDGASGDDFCAAEMNDNADRIVVAIQGVSPSFVEEALKEIIPCFNGVFKCKHLVAIRSKTAQSYIPKVMELILPKVQDGSIDMECLDKIVAPMYSSNVPDVIVLFRKKIKKPISIQSLVPPLDHCYRSDRLKVVKSFSPFVVREFSNADLKSVLDMLPGGDRVVAAKYFMYPEKALAQDDPYGLKFIQEMLGMDKAN